MTDDDEVVFPPEPPYGPFNPWIEKAQAIRHSTALRHLWRAGRDDLVPLNEWDELCQWDGPLLPLEPMDRAVGAHSYDTILHGTDRGYQQHRRLGLPICDDCRLAHRNEGRRRREQARQNKQRLEETV
jgi:hypothetical protein